MSCLKIFGLPSQTRKKLNRALKLRGLGSQSKWLLTMVNRVIVETEREHGNLLLVLTAEEQWVVDTVSNGAAELEQVAEETQLPLVRAEAILADLLDRNVLETRPQGAASEKSRGARRTLYFVSEKYQSKTE